MPWLAEESDEHHPARCKLSEINQHILDRYTCKCKYLYIRMNKWKKFVPAGPVPVSFGTTPVSNGTHSLVWVFQESDPGWPSKCLPRNPQHMSVGQYEVGEDGQLPSGPESIYLSINIHCMCTIHVKMYINQICFSIIPRNNPVSASWTWNRKPGELASCGCLIL